MTGIGLFIVLVTLLTLQAACRGGAPERLASAAMLMATIATVLSNTAMAHAFRSVEWEVLWIDVSLLSGLVLIALFADRFWPMWVAALQGFAVAAHGARGIEPQLLPYSYWLVLGKLSYPMIAILCIAIERHQWRKRRGYPEAAWSRTAWPDHEPANANGQSGALAIRIRTQDRGAQS